ncbi:restriction endonuclease subunit S [Chromobacterium aquaticum]|uniref:Restriction endonuclease subunit S n=1 Tax=Chromobacterium aquaticum TaxID=467180 RepID=A0ABV8ZSK2_9NEIS|nr:restriction endonuclease subunit S [Chromobacterium aquaticum]MCD5361255.1 restriction endonuclease subunit S [Chromobacterium aquaticum]
MKNDAWSWRPLGELFEIGAGKTMSAAARAGVAKTPFLRTSNVLWDEIDLTTVDEMTIPEHELPDKLVRPGDLLVCEGGEIGRAAIWNGEMTVMSFQNHLHRLRPLVDDVEPRFYVYFLQSAFTQLGLFAGAGNKTTIPNLSRNRLAALEVPHPPQTEQKAIATALARVRSAMQTHDRSMAAAQELKRSAMLELFTQGLLGEPQKETEIGLIPEGWESVELGKVCTLSTGTTPATKHKHYYDGNIPFIKTADVVNNRITSANTFISQQAIDDYSLKLFPPGTVLMAMYGQGKTRGQVSLLEIAAATTQNAAAIQPSNEMDSAYLWHYLLSCYERLRGMGSLGHVSHLNLGYLRDLLIVKPPLEEQRDIARFLDTIDRKIDLHKQKRDVMGELFMALLQRLMTGEINSEELDLSALESVGATIEESQV